MRIGLDFRVLAVGRQNVIRGIPRFTQEQLQSVLKLDRDNTYLLLCDPGDDIGAIRPEIRAAPNAHILFALDPSPRAFDHDDDMRTLLARYSAYQRWIEGLQLDLYHSTCPFWVSRLILPGFDVCPYVVTAYDLMPLLYPVNVPHEPAEAYRRGLLFLEQATRVAAISEATASALVEHLGLPADRIDLTLPAISPCFRPLPDGVTRSLLASLQHPSRRSSRRRVAIPAEFVLSVTDLHYTKNLFTLLTAYAQLPAATRSRFPLVIAGHLAPGEVDVVYRRARALGIEAGVILTGRVSDHELMGLYNGATLVVHPSHYEGFGLTVAEAMRSGTPVVTTTRSAMPEVTADAALLVDSEDASAFTDAMDRLLGDRELREELRRRGLDQSARFTTAALGQATLDCYEHALSAARATAACPFRVALWSPVATQDAGAAEFADDLISGLSAEPGLQLDLFVDDGVMPSLDLMRLARVHHWSDFDRCAQKAQFDATVYQLDTSPFHRRVEQAVLANPGILVLHDPQTADPLLVDAATGCVTLGPQAGAQVQRRHPNADVRVIPIGVRDPRLDGFGVDRTMARAYLDLEPRAFVIVARGPLDSAAQIDALVSAVADLRRSGAAAVLAAVGPMPHAFVSVLRARAARLGLGEALRVTGPVSRTVSDAYLAACDVTVLVRDATQAAIPAELMRACAAERCMVISDVPAWASVPDSACIRVRLPLDRVAVRAALSTLADDPARRHDLERGARHYFEAAGSFDRMVEGYMRAIGGQARRDGQLRGPGAVLARDAIRDGRPGPRSGPLPYSKPCELEDFVHPDLRGVIAAVAPHKRAVFGADFPRGHEHRDDWEAAMAVRTLTDHGMLREDARVLGMAERVPDSFFYLTRHVGEVVAVGAMNAPLQALPSNGASVAPFAFRADRFTVRQTGADALRYPDESFDAVVMRLTVDHVRDLHAVARALYETGRVLKPGGVLSCSTELLISSDPDGERTSPVGPLTSGELRRYIVQASGLEPIDDMRLSVSHWTLSTTRDIEAATASCRARMIAQPEGSRSPQWSCWDMPHVVLQRRGHRYTSIHLALRRAPMHPATGNT